MSITSKKNPSLSFKKFVQPSDKIFGKRVICGNRFSIEIPNSRRILIRRAIARKAMANKMRPSQMGLNVYFTVEAFKLEASKFNGISPFRKFVQPIEKRSSAKEGKEKSYMDDTLSRTHIWKTLFGTASMPQIEEKAAEKYSGTLDFPDDFDFDKIARKVRKGR